MSTKKIADVPKACQHPEHLPPAYRVFKPGMYEHTCPACKKKTIFTIKDVRLAVDGVPRLTYEQFKKTNSR